MDTDHSGNSGRASTDQRGEPTPHEKSQPAPQVGTGYRGQDDRGGSRSGQGANKK